MSPAVDKAFDANIFFREFVRLGIFDRTYGFSRGSDPQDYI